MSFSIQTTLNLTFAYPCIFGKRRPWWSLVPSPISGVLGCPALKVWQLELGMEEEGCVPGTPRGMPFTTLQMSWMLWSLVLCSGVSGRELMSPAKPDGTPGHSLLSSWSLWFVKVLQLRQFLIAESLLSVQKSKPFAPLNGNLLSQKGRLTTNSNLLLLTWRYLCDSPLECILLQGKAGIFWHFSHLSPKDPVMQIRKSCLFFKRQTCLLFAANG